MKRFIYIVIVFIFITNNIFAFEILDVSKVLWDNFYSLYKDYLNKILESNSIDEINKIEELYEEKINATLQDKIYLSYYQDKWLYDNALNITSAFLTNFSLSSGNYYCRLNLTFTAKTNILEPNYLYIGGIINIKLDDKIYSLKNLTIYDLDWKVLLSETFRLEPKSIYKGQTGLIKMDMSSINHNILRNGNIISIR